MLLFREMKIFMPRVSAFTIQTFFYQIKHFLKINLRSEDIEIQSFSAMKAYEVKIWS